MLDDIISLSLRHFQRDCLQLCEYHYPTIHNRGMRETHMGKALARRVASTFHSQDVAAHFEQLEEEKHQQPVYRVVSSVGDIIVVAHRMISANKACRLGLVRDLQRSLEHTDTSENKDYRVVVIADHWMDRSAASKSVASWWLGHQPIHIDEYRSQGIKLIDADHSLANDIENTIGLINGQHRLFHPLNRQKDSIPLYKYLLMAAFYDLTPKTIGAPPLNS